MFNVFDFMWVEFRGMSVLTAIFFLGSFTSIAAVFWYVRREFDYVYTRITNHGLHLDEADNELGSLTTELAVIKNICKNTEKSVNRLDGSINRLGEKIHK